MQLKSYISLEILHYRSMRCSLRVMLTDWLCCYYLSYYLMQSVVRHSYKASWDSTIGGGSSHPTCDDNVVALQYMDTCYFSLMATVDRSLLMVIEIHLKRFHRLTARYPQRSLPRMRTDLEREVFFVVQSPQNSSDVHHHSLAFSLSLMMRKKLWVYACNVIVQSHGIPLQMDYCRFSALWFDHSVEKKKIFRLGSKIL